MAGHHAVDASEHHRSVELLAILEEDGFVSDLSHGGGEGEVEVSAVNDRAVHIVSDDRCAEGAEFVDVLRQKKHLGVDAEGRAHTLQLHVVFRLDPPEIARELL